MSINVKILLVGLATGIVSGLLGSGGGLILVPAYSIIFSGEEKEVKSTVIFCIFPIVISSALIYGLNSYISWEITIKCCVGEIIGSFLGSKILNILNPKYLKFIFILFLLYASTRILFFS